jgi:hypothetical protein
MANRKRYQFDAYGEYVVPKLWQLDQWFCHTFRRLSVTSVMQKLGNTKLQRRK